MNRFRNTRQPDRDWWSRLWPTPEHTLESLGIEPRTTVADIGCGDGYFTLAAARLVDGASVYALDLDESLLETVASAASEAGLTNVETLHADARDFPTHLPEAVDCVLIANTFHGVEEKERFAAAAYRSLRPAGRFVVVNWDDRPRETTTVAGEARGPPDALRLSPERTRNVLAAAGFSGIETIDLPPYHYAVVGRRE